MTTAIDAHVASARAMWPTLAVDEAAYRAWLTSCSTDDLARLPSLSAGEVLLCWAAGRGDGEAQRLFDLHFMPQVEPALRKFKPDSAFVDEITQRVRMKLLMAKDGSVPAIAKYAFGGSLAGLVRVAAVREGLNLRKSDKPAAPPDALEQLAGELDPELRALKTKYAVEFERAFVDAVAALPGRDRHLLRLSLSVGASIDDIARIYNTHRATAARWLNAARDALGDRTRANLQARLGLHDSEVMSLLRLVRTEAARLMQSIPPSDDEDAG